MPTNALAGNAMSCEHERSSTNDMAMQHDKHEMSEEHVPYLSSKYLHDNMPIDKSMSDQSCCNDTCLCEASSCFTFPIMHEKPAAELSLALQSLLIPLLQTYGQSEYQNYLFKPPIFTFS